MCGTTAKDTSITPVAKGHLQIPAITLLGWAEVECHHSLPFTTMLLNEQNLLKAAERKSDHSGPTVDELFDKHPDQPQHTIKKGQPRFEKHFDTDTRKVMVTCQHKRNHWKDLVITGVSILGATRTHLLIPPMLPQSRPLSTNQALIDC